MVPGVTGANAIVALASHRPRHRQRWWYSGANSTPLEQQASPPTAQQITSGVRASPSRHFLFGISRANELQSAIVVLSLWYVFMVFIVALALCYRVMFNNYAYLPWVTAWSIMMFMVVQCTRARAQQLQFSPTCPCGKTQCSCYPHGHAARHFAHWPHCELLHRAQCALAMGSSASAERF